MKTHPTLWLSAFHDGELNQEQAQTVKSHLENCVACQLELAQLANLSQLLQNAPPAILPVSPELFIDQVITKIQASPKPTYTKGTRKSSWWLMPALLISAWAFLQALILISGLLFQFEPIRAFTQVSPGSPTLLQQLLAFSPFPGAFNWLSPILGVLPGGDVLLLLLFNILTSSLCAFLLASWLAGWYAYLKQDPIMAVENRFSAG